MPRKMNCRKSVWLVVSTALVVLLPSIARAQSETVKLGDLAAISNAAIYIAIEKGFFKEQGVNTEISNFASAAKMVPALVVGELEVSVGSASAGLFNAVAEKAPFRIVADKGQTREGTAFHFWQYAKTWSTRDKSKRSGTSKERRSPFSLRETFSIIW